MWLFPSFAHRSTVDLGFLTKRFLVLNCDHFLETHFSPCDWAMPPACLAGVHHGDNNCSLMLNRGVHMSMCGRRGGAWSFAFQHSLNPHGDFVVLLLCVNEYPIISGDKGKLGRRNITDADVLAFPACSDTESEIDTDPQKKRERKKTSPTHISAFPSHLTAMLSG